MESKDEDIKDFLQKSENILDLSRYSNESLINDVINSKLVEFIKASSDMYEKYLKEDRDFCHLGLILIGSDLFQNHKEFCLGKMLSLLSIDLLEMPMKFLISYILLLECKNDIGSIEIIVKFQGFNVIYYTLSTQFAYFYKYEDNVHGDDEVELEIITDMKKIATILMDILYQTFKYSKCDSDHIRIVDDFFICYLLTTIRSDVLTDLYNNAKFKLLLAVNEQFMMFKKFKGIENKVFYHLLNEETPRTFLDLILLKFNRREDASQQIMMCKVIYLIVSTTENNFAKNYFYLNDLNVFVDVLLRQLQNLSNNDELLRHTLLRILTPLLQNTELSETHYRRADIEELLVCLISPHSLYNTDESEADYKLTVSLASKCLKCVSWLTTPLERVKETSVDSDHELSRSSTFSISNIGSSSPIVFPQNGNSDPKQISTRNMDMRKYKKPPPPPPPPPSRKCHSKSKQ